MERRHKNKPGVLQKKRKEKKKIQQSNVRNMKRKKKHDKEYKKVLHCKNISIFGHDHFILKLVKKKNPPVGMR